MAAASNVSAALADLRAKLRSDPIGPHRATTGPPGAVPTQVIRHPPPPKPWKEMTAAEVEAYYERIGWGGGSVGGSVSKKFQAVRVDG